MYCSRHPKVETALSCGRCSTPICTDCCVSGAVGMLCRKCAYGDGNPLEKVRPERWALTIAMSVVAGIGVGFLLQVLGGFFMFFICPMIGGFLGQVILWSSGHKRGRKLEILAGASVVGGAIVASLIDGMFFLFLKNPLSLVLFIVAIGLTAGAAVTRLRYW